MRPPSMRSASKPRATLSVAQAITIFRDRASSISAAEIATCYGVTEKAVRDIWKGRTWSKETGHLDTSRTRQSKPVGRPKGRKDLKPRKKRSTVQYRCKLPSCDESPVQVSSSQHNGMYSMPVQAYEQGPASWESQVSQRMGSALFFEGSSFWHRATEAWQTSSALHHGSVDEQLHAWEEFWSTSCSADPFNDDWTSMALLIWDDRIY